jgi:CTP synthase
VTTWARPSRSSRTSPTRSSDASALATDDVDVVITEVGGTVGDIEILPFLEAIRQFRLDVGRDNVCYVHVTLVPFIGPSGEQKTKPTQHSVTELRSRGIQPDAIVCRSEGPIARAQAQDLEPVRRRRRGGQRCRRRSLYDIPLVLHDEGLDRRGVLGRCSATDTPPPDLTDWKAWSSQVEAAAAPVRIGIVGKYVSLPDAYLSVVESLNHAVGFRHGANVEIEWIQAEEVEGLLAAGAPPRPRRHRDPRRVR